MSEKSQELKKIHGSLFQPEYELALHLQNYAVGSKDPYTGRTFGFVPREDSVLDQEMVDLLAVAHSAARKLRIKIFNAMLKEKE